MPPSHTLHCIFKRTPAGLGEMMGASMCIANCGGSFLSNSSGTDQDTSEYDQCVTDCSNGGDSGAAQAYAQVAVVLAAAAAALF